MAIARALALFFAAMHCSLLFAAQSLVERGLALSTTCAACHGADGNSQQAIWPKLAGQNARYLYQQMVAFKKGNAEGGRYAASMTPLMQSLSNEDMKALAAYYAAQNPSSGSASPEQLALGGQVYRGGILAKKVAACAACHGPRGLGNEAAGFPRLSGQHSAYTQQQLMNYKTGARTNGPKDIMPTLAKRMSNEEIAAVANFTAGLY